MADAPAFPDWVEGEVATEAKMDSISTAGSFLRSPPIAMLDRSTDQTIATSTHTAVQWNTETYDTANGHDTVTNNSRYTAQYDGIYALTASVPFANNSTSYKMELYFKRSDGVEYNGQSQTKTTSDTTQCLSSSTQMGLLTGEYAEVWVWHNRGSNLAIDSAFHGGPKFCVQWIYPL